MASNNLFSGCLGDFHSPSSPYRQRGVQVPSIQAREPRPCRSRPAVGKGGLRSNTWLYMDSSYLVNRLLRSTRSPIEVYYWVCWVWCKRHGIYVWWVCVWNNVVFLKTIIKVKSWLIYIWVFSSILVWAWARTGFVLCMLLCDLP